MSIFSAGIFYAPNKVHPIDDLRLLPTIVKNPLMAALVGVTWLLYIWLFLWARRMDKEDLLKVTTI